MRFRFLAYLAPVLREVKKRLDPNTPFIYVGSKRSTYGVAPAAVRKKSECPCLPVLSTITKSRGVKLHADAFPARPADIADDTTGSLKKLFTADQIKKIILKIDFMGLTPLRTCPIRRFQNYTAGTYPRGMYARALPQPEPSLRDDTVTVASESASRTDTAIDVNTTQQSGSLDSDSLSSAVFSAAAAAADDEDDSDLSLSPFTIHPDYEIEVTGVHLESEDAHMESEDTSVEVLVEPDDIASKYAQRPRRRRR